MLYAARYLNHNRFNLLRSSKKPSQENQDGDHPIIHDVTSRSWHVSANKAKAEGVCDYIR